MASNRKEVVSKVAVALTGIEADVAIPSRVRSHSFASVLVDMRVGDAPACRALQVDVDACTSATLRDATTEAKERLRNNVQSSINQAKRRSEGAAYSVECVSVLSDSGIYVIALVRRIA